jgi:hypothetical protein
MPENADQSFDDTVLRTLVVLGLVGVALVHFVDVFGKFRETPYLGYLYVALIAVCLIVAFVLALRGSVTTWSAAAIVAALPFIAYIISRTSGLPSSTDDIGNWMEPLGLASLFVEGLIVLVGASMAWLSAVGTHALPGRRRHDAQPVAAQGQIALGRQ